MKPRNRAQIPLSALLVGCTFLHAWAAEPATFSTLPLSGTVHLLQGNDCNIVASIGADGIVLVDTCTADTADQLSGALGRLSRAPLRFVINTHVHGDHTGGNAHFQKLAPVIAAPSGRTWLVTGNDANRDKPSPPAAWPTLTFSSEMTLHLNGEEISLLKLPPAHTDSDLVVFFKNANVVAMGDVFMSPAVSFGSRQYGGGMIKLIAALELLVPQIPVDAKVVPGHGAVSSRADVIRGLEILKQMKAAVEDAVRSGKTLEQLTAERPFDKWKSALPSWRSSDRSMDGQVRDFYRELTQAQ